ncbi:MAG: hypothetical protein AAGA55_03435, partial [Planctomycetota bacterium]
GSKAFGGFWLSPDDIVPSLAGHPSGSHPLKSAMSDWVRATLVSRHDEAAMIRYGLELRGINSELHRSAKGSTEPWEVVVPARDADRARAALPAIWDAVLELPRAIRPDGSCPFCGYDNIGVPAHSPCPECGVHLSSVEARRAYRDGQHLER